MTLMVRAVPSEGGSAPRPTATNIVRLCIARARYLCKRTKDKREGARGALPNVVSTVKDHSVVDKPPANPRPARGNRSKVPKRVSISPNSARTAFVREYMRTGIAPQPTSPVPPQNFESNFRRHRPVPVPENRDSVLSIDSASTQFSITSLASSVVSMPKQKVRQTFEPVMPDELLVSHGERLEVMQLLQDDWCIICRPKLGASDDVEIGVVPAWCFIKPLPGLRAERPLRLASLDFAAQIEQLDQSSRPETTSC